jgi:hypothetical protein
VYLFIITGIQFEKPLAGGKTFSLVFSTGNISQTALFQLLMPHLPNSHFIVGVLIIAASVIGCAFYAAPAILSSFGIVRRYFVKGENREFTGVLFIIIVLIGMALYYLTDFSSGQGYFLFCALPLISVLAFRFFEDIKALYGQRKAWIGKVVTILFVIGLCASAETYVQQNIQGVKNAVMEYRLEAPTEKPYLNVWQKTKYNSISHAEYEAMLWVKENTERDALFATNRKSLFEDSENMASTFFYYSAYSQRHFYVEGAFYSFLRYDPEELAKRVKINDAIYDKVNTDRASIARQYGIEYVVASTLIDPDPGLENAEMKEVFENDDVIIYKVEK